MHGKSVSVKSCLVLLLAITLCVWDTKWQAKAKPDYWQLLPRFVEANVTRNVPNPREQSILYQSVEEIVNPIKAEPSGKIPTWLRGTLLTNGPGLFEFRDQKADHLFDGMAMIRRYHVDDTMLSISRRLIESEFLKRNRAEERFTMMGMFTSPAHFTIWDRLGAIFKQDVTDNVLVNTIKLFGHYYAATEVPIVIEYDPDTLETLGRFDLGKIISDVRLITAHPLYESDGTMWNIASATGLDSKGQFNGVWRYVIFKVTPPQTEAERKKSMVKN